MIVREDAGAVAVVRLAHGKVSAIDLELCGAVQREIEDIARGTPTALVLTGTGTTFSAGVDLFRVLEGGDGYLDAFLPAMVELFRAVVTFPKPAVAAVNGHAIAGGCILAAACDHRLMANGGGRIGVPELAVGVPFPSLPFEIVRARVAPSTLRRLIDFAPVVPASDAVSLGLIDEIVEPGALMDRAFDAARWLAAIPPASFALTKRHFTAPVLDRAQAAAATDADVMAAWKSAAVRDHIRKYVDATLGKKGR